MQGFPNHLNNRYDYEFIRAHFPPDRWRPAWRALLDGRFVWADAQELTDGQSGVADEDNRAVDLAPAGPDKPRRRVQQTRRENPAAKLFRLGFTVAEVLEALGEEPEDDTPAPSSEEDRRYRLNASGTYHAAGCGYAGEAGPLHTLAEIAAAKPDARPCGRCKPLALA